VRSNPDGKQNGDIVSERIIFNVVIRRLAAGEDHTRQIFAHDEVTARERAIARARTARGIPMAERECGQFEVLSCTPAIDGVIP
jgi:hypothetical protein